MRYNRAGLLVLGACLTMPAAAEAQSNTPADAAALAARSATVATVQVIGHRDDTPAKLDHIMPEVAGTKITVTKKTTVTKLDQQPTVIDNNLQELFVHSPGILVTQQQTPTQFNLSYRGLGNPQESEYVLVLQDGLPITTDWIGFPTLYYLPLTQGISEVQEIRGGSSLLYGPEPAPAINFVSKRPAPGGPLTGYTEQVGGSDGLYSTYNVLQGSAGKLSFRTDLGYVRSEGERTNAQSNVREGDLYLDYRPDATQRIGLDLHAYDANSGDPGRIGYTQFRSDPSFSPTPDNQDWVSRYSGTLSYDRDFAGSWRLEGKVWGTYQDLASRSAANSAAPTSTTLQDELFRSEGLDLRLRDRWGRGNAFTIGVEAYHDDAPFRQFTSADVLADSSDDSGTARLRQARQSNYEAIFAENVFRLPYRIHVVPSVRIEREEVEVNETVRPPFLSRPLLDARFTRSDLPNQVGRVPAFAPHALGKYGVTFRAEGRYSVSLTGVSVSSQFFQDSDLPVGFGTGFIPAKVGGYSVLDLAADWYLTRRLRVLGGISNLGDVRYYSRVFQNGIEPALGRNVYAGLALGF